MPTYANPLKRLIPALLLAFAIVAVAGVARAACNSSCDNAPIIVPPPPAIFLEPQPPQPLVSAAYCADGSCGTGVCSTCTDARVQPTTLPGRYSNDYDYAVTSQRNTTGIPYLIPTAGGLLESPTIPLTNAVDQYYATHSVVGNQVVRTAPTPPNRAVAAQFNYRNQDMSLAYAPGGYYYGR